MLVQPNRLAELLLALGERGVFVCIAPHRAAGCNLRVWFWEEDMSGCVVCPCTNEDQMLDALSAYLATCKQGVYTSA
jgi:hypothetical protein